MKKIIVITINFNSAEETHNCLLSLHKLSKGDYEISIIVVDNGSKEPFILTSEEKKREIKLIRTDHNLGFTGGNNIGIQDALSQDSDYIMLINNDTLVDPDLIKELLMVVEKDPKIGLVGPKIYFAKGHEYHKERYKKEELGKVLWYAGGKIDWKNVLSTHMGMDEVDHGQYDKEKEVDFVTGCCMFFKKEVLQKIKGFDDNYFLYYEDADITMNTIKQGYTVMYAPKAVIWHVNAASGGGAGSILHDYYLTRNKLIFGMKFANVRLKFALFRESIRLLLHGREWQRRGIEDYFLHRLGKGSFNI